LIFYIFGTELICNITVTDLPASPMYCCYTTLENINCCIGPSSKDLIGQSHLCMHKTLCPTFDVGLWIVVMLMLLIVECGPWRQWPLWDNSSEPWWRV